MPRKNIRPLAGRPLLAYTCEAALGSRRLSRVLLSSDDDEIMAEGRKCGVEVPFRRPPELSSDDASSVAVAAHALEWIRATTGRLPDALCLLQPTSPFRRAEHIDEAFDRMISTGAESIVSVVRLAHGVQPHCILRIEEGMLQRHDGGEMRAPLLARQSLPTLYARNGPAVLIASSRSILKGTFYEPPVVPYEMLPEDSLDIDTPYDFHLADLMMRYRCGLPCAP